MVLPAVVPVSLGSFAARIDVPAVGGGSVVAVCVVGGVFGVWAWVFFVDGAASGVVDFARVNYGRYVVEVIVVVGVGSVLFRRVRWFVFECEFGEGFYSVEVSDDRFADYRVGGSSVRVSSVVSGVDCRVFEGFVVGVGAFFCVRGSDYCGHPMGNFRLRVFCETSFGWCLPWQLQPCSLSLSSWSYSYLSWSQPLQ